jgi:hypothetical protein
LKRPWRATKLQAVVPWAQLNLVLSVPCSLGVAKNLFKVLIGDKQRRRSIVNQKAEKRVVSLQLSQVDLADSKEGSSVAVHFGIPNIDSRRTFTDPEERFTSPDFMKLTKAPMERIENCDFVKIRHGR